MLLPGSRDIISGKAINAIPTSINPTEQNLLQLFHSSVAGT